METLEELVIADLEERIEAAMRDWRATADATARRTIAISIVRDIHRVLDALDVE